MEKTGNRKVWKTPPRYFVAPPGTSSDTESTPTKRRSYVVPAITGMEVQTEKLLAASGLKVTATLMVEDWAEGEETSDVWLDQF